MFIIKAKVLFYEIANYSPETNYGVCFLPEASGYISAGGAEETEGNASFPVSSMWRKEVLLLPWFFHKPQGASLYVFSVVTRLLPTNRRWDSSIGKMERLVRELNIRTDPGGARLSEDGLLRVVKLKYAKLINPKAWKGVMKFKPEIDGSELGLEMAA